MVQRWNVCAIVFWRVVWYRAGTFLLCDHVRARRGRRGHGVAVAVPWRGRRALGVVASLGVAVARRGRGAAWPWLWCPLSLCRRRVVATRRRMLVFTMVLVASVLSWFAI